MSEIGSLLFALSLATSSGAFLTSIFYVKNQKIEYLVLSRQLVYLHFIVLTGSLLTLLVSLVRGDFSLVYVAENVNTTLPLFYRFTALWAGQAGSLLWWNFLLVLFSLIAIEQIAYREERLVPFLIAILMAISFFFCALGNFSETSDPFREILQDEEKFNPGNGRGLNPLLQHWAMIIHPPVLYFGYVSFAIPYAIAMAALLAKEKDIEWTKLVRRWALFSWFFLGTGILLGGKWAYEELGWGGYWAWDPVENASLMPWLSGTAFLHSIIVQERRGMLKVWNMVLISLSFIMTIFGTFLTRSGVVSSVHSFTNSNLGPFFVGFIIITTIFSSYLIIKNLNFLKSDRPFQSWLSREVGFLFNNIILMIALFAVVWGTLYPTLSEAFTGTRVSVTAEWFNEWMTPLGLMILFLTGTGPLLAWRETSWQTLKRNFRLPLWFFGITFVLSIAGLLYVNKTFNLELSHFYAVLAFSLSAFVTVGVLEEWYKATHKRKEYYKENWLKAFVSVLFQNKRRYLGYMAHVGLAILFVGFAGKAFTKEKRIELAIGEAENVAGYLIFLENVESLQVGKKNQIHYFTTKATISVYQKNSFIGRDTTEIRQYPMFSLATLSYSDPPQTTSEPAIITKFKADVYVQLGGINDKGRYILQVWINPLVFWVWFGFGFFVFATLLLLLPIGEKKPEQIENLAFLTSYP